MQMLLEGAINALGKVGLMLNVHKNDLTAVLGVLPALKRPTISHLSDDEWLAVNTILDESTVRDIIPRLKEAGGAGHRRISAEQDRPVDPDHSKANEVGPPAGAQGGAVRRSGSRGAADSRSRAQARRSARCWNTRASSMGSTRKSVRVPESELRSGCAARRRNSAPPWTTAAANIRAYARAAAARANGAKLRPGCGWARSCGRSIRWPRTSRRAAIRCPPR